MSYSPLLRRSQLFGNLRDETLDRLALIMTGRSVEKSTIIFFQNDTDGSLYVVERGCVEISIVNDEGKKLTLNLMQPNDVFGEIALLDGKPRTATATAVEDTALLVISRPDCLQLMRQDPSIATDVMELLCDRIRWISRQVEDLAFLDVSTRLARRLLIIHDKFSDKNGRINLTQNELGEFLGVTRESINKVLNKWQKDGWIKKERGALRILAIDKINEIAD